MIRLLPLCLVIVLIAGGLGYWRFAASPSKLTTPTETSEDEPIEVPSTLPKASIEDRVQELEDVVTKLVTQVNSLKSPVPQTSADSNLSNVQSSVTELKARVSALEKATPAPVSSTQSVVYIPLGSGGGPWGDRDWYTTSEYEVFLDPANYPGYKNMVLEASFRLNVVSGTGSVRLYNVTDSSAVLGQMDTTLNTFSLKTSLPFTLPPGSKTYKLQVKSVDGTTLYVQSARIKVSF